MGSDGCTDETPEILRAGRLNPFKRAAGALEGRPSKNRQSGLEVK